MARFENHVSLAPQFQRSVRIDLDWGNAGALRGYLCQSSTAQTLLAMAGHLAENHQSAFTWTGPYGGGKSSLALMLGTLLGGEPPLRRLAQESLGPEIVAKLAKPFRVPTSGRSRTWQVVRVSGSRKDPVAEIVRALCEADIPRIGKRLGDKPDGPRVLKVLGDLAERPDHGGLLLLIDELGKFLEFVAGYGGDIHFFQELAEVASRSNGRLVVVGILHQAFEQYAARLGRESRDEWVKIQGRFADIPVVAAVDEVIELTSRAINATKRAPQGSTASTVARAILKNRPSSAKNLADRLSRCWPLHPVTAALLGPVSRRRFGQNERSTFAFLGSSEPLGFQDFLKNTEALLGVTYEPARYWDYLRTNLEPAILASPDGHRWAQAAEAVSRCEGRGDGLRLQLIKSIAVIDLFRNGSGLVASREVLGTCVLNATDDEVDVALRDLVEWSVAIYRKHRDGYGVFEGSDFDIDAAAKRQLGQSFALDVGRLGRLASLQPILPKRHYQLTGALRWFDSVLATTETVNEAVDSFDPSGGAAGRFILVIADDQYPDRKRRQLCKDASLRRADYSIVVGLPPNGDTIRGLGREMIAIEALQANHPELSGDAVARKELQARIAAVSAKLEDELSRAREHAEWFVNGKPQVIRGLSDLHALASTLCDRTFRASPPIHSELVNRPSVSSNAQAAVNLLVAHMIGNPGRFAFGIEGYGPERGLYESVYFKTGLHRERELNDFEFARPLDGSDNASFVALWAEADNLLSKSNRVVPLSELFTAWSRPPFGLRKGVIGLIALAYLLSNRTQIAVYQDNHYLPELTEMFVHEVIRDPSVIGLRKVVANTDQTDLLNRLATAITDALCIPCQPEPLAIGRALVKFVFDLPPWSRRTGYVSEVAAKLRSILLSASDPHKLVFVDLPSLALETNEKVDELLRSRLREMSVAYPDMLGGVREKFFRALAANDPSPAILRERADTVKGITGNLRVEALAARLVQFTGSIESVEGLLSLAVNKPPRDWTDLDVDGATLALAELAHRFRNAEVLAGVRGRSPSRLALGLAIGTGEDGKARFRSVDVGNDEMKGVEKMTESVLNLISGSGQDPRLALAAIAYAGEALIEQLPESEA